MPTLGDERHDEPVPYRAAVDTSAFREPVVDDWPTGEPVRREFRRPWVEAKDRERLRLGGWIALFGIGSRLLPDMALSLRPIRDLADVVPLVSIIRVISAISVLATIAAALMILYSMRRSGWLSFVTAGVVLVALGVAYNWLPLDQPEEMVALARSQDQEAAEEDVASTPSGQLDSSPDASRGGLALPAAEAKTVRLELVGIDGLEVVPHLEERLSLMVDADASPVIRITVGAESASATISPVTDLAAFRKKIDFGNVVDAIESRRFFRVTADRTRFPRFFGAPGAPVAFQPPITSQPAIAPAKPAADAPGEPDGMEHLLGQLQSAAGPEAILMACDKLAAATPTVAYRDKVAKALSSLLNHTNEGTRLASLRALEVWWTPEVLPNMVQCIADAAPNVRDAAIGILARKRDPAVVAAVLKYWADDPDKVGPLVMMLGNLGEDTAQKALRHSNHQFRRRACEVLARIGTGDSLPSLRRLTREWDRQVADAANRAILEIEARESLNGPEATGNRGAPDLHH